MTDTARVTTVRLPQAMAEELEAVARALGLTVSEVVRVAISEHIATRKGDPGFRARLAASIARDQARLAALSRDPLAEEAMTDAHTAENDATCPKEGACHYDGDLCDYCKTLAAKYDGWEPWEDATWD